MSNKTVNLDALNDAIKNALDEYHTEVVEGIKKETVEAMAELVEKTKATAPVGNRKGKYKRSITSRVDSENKYGVTMAWYVKGKEYRLTHLLNDGHALRNGGRYAGTKFLDNATEEIQAKYLRAIEEVVKRG
jgi:uncharacterized protein (DUF2147 family)